MKATTWEAWLEWKWKCALVRCGAPTRQLLSDWAVPQIRNIVRRFDPNHSLAVPSADPPFTIDPAWSAMEVHLAAGRKSSGPPFKDALFRCVQYEPSDEDKRNALERYFSRTCQNEIPKLVLREQSEIAKARAQGIDMVPLDQPVGPSPDAPTIGDLYAGADHEALEPDSKAADTELDAIARQEAEEWLPHLTTREKLAWGCASAQRSLNDPAVLAAAGCGKTQFYDAAKRAEGMQQFRISLFAKYAESDEETLRELAIRAGSELARMCIPLLPPENLSADDL